MNTLEQILAKLDKGEAITPEEKRELFKAMGGNDTLAMELRRDYAASRADVVAPLIAQQSLIRNIFRERTSDDGQALKFPIRSKRVRSAWFTSGAGTAPQRTAEIDEVSFPTFDIKAGCRWPVDYYRSGSYDIVEDLENDAIEDVVYKENAAGWSLIQAASIHGDAMRIAKLATEDGFTLKVLKTILTRMDEQVDDSRRVTDIYLSPSRYYQLIDWAKLDTQQLPDGTRQEIFSKGDAGLSQLLSGFNIAIHKVSKPEFVDDDAMYGFDRNRFGYMPVEKRWETVQDTQAAMTWEDGWVGRKKCGFGIVDLPSMVRYDFKA